jgi:single-stranded-DNA-specific exonuclease
MFAVGRIVINENSLPDSHQVSFQIAPRLNAAGRMDHANVAFNLIMESDVVRARSLALELEAKNQERQKVTGRIVEEVRVMANAMFGDKKFIFAVGEHFPSGILGLAAGKIADEFGKPTGIFQRKGEEVKGSFRSIPQVNIIEMIEKCGDLLEKYGGHSQAAGIVIQHKNCEAFFQRMNDLIEEALRGKEISSEILIDVEVFPKDVDFDLAEGLEKFEPFGEGNKEPVFLMKNLLIREIKLVGNGEKHLKLFLGAEDGSPKIFEAIGFGLAADNLHLEIGQKVDIVFNLGLDEWNGNKKMQLKLIDIKLVGKE